MGNCIAIQKNQPPSKLQWSLIKENRLSATEHSLKPQSPPMTHHVASFQELSGKDEMFFDANVWMDSDCDDFFSVNGDTPSRGTTPVHPNSCTEAPKLDKSLYLVDTSNSPPRPSPTEMKQLIEFFRDSFSGDLADRDQYLQGLMETKPTNFDLPPKSSNGSPYRSASSPACNVEPTPNRKQKSPRSAQCCLPSLVRSLSSVDRKKRASPKDSG